MKKTVFFISSLLVLSAVSCGKKAATTNDEAAAPVDTLTYSVAAFGDETATGVFPVDEEGFTVLFGGKDLTGWRGYGRDTIPGGWTADDSTLHFVPAEGKGGDIIFAHNFDNFDVQFDWKVSEGANSGFFYMGQEFKDADGNLGWLFVTTPEYQILDNVNHPDAKLGVNGNRQSASLYDLIAANPQNAKPWGEWNTARVVVNNGHVEHYQNGEKVLEYDMWTPEWTEMLQNSKFNEKDLPVAFEKLNDKHNGFFAFQDHGNEVWYRNVRVKELK